MKTILFYTDQKYEHQALNLLKSFKVNNKLDYNFLYYTIGFKSTIEFPNLVTKEWPIDTKIPISPENNKPFFEFYKPVICLDALQDYDDICFLDTDIVISRRFTLDHLSNDKEHPLCCYCAYEYPFVYKHNDDGTTTIYNEVRLMEYYNVPKRSMRYAQTCFILFNRKCINFLKEWVSMCKNDYLLGFIENNCLIYYPSRDETAFNVCLWKHNYTDNLGHLFLNSWKIDIIKQVEEDDNIRGVEFDGNLIEYCHDSSQVILYHGLKSDPAEYAKIFEYFESRNKLKTEEKIMRICQVTPGLIEIPPKGWGAVEKIIWQYKLGFESLGHVVDIKYLNEVNLKEYDIVHIHMANLALIAHDMGIPYVFTCHDHHAYLYGRTSDVYKQNLEAMRHAKLAIVPAEYLVEYFDNVPVFLPHGVDTNFFTPSNSAEKTFSLLCVGNNGLAGDPTNDRKGFGYAIQAANKLYLRLNICGPRNYNEIFFDSHPELLSDTGNRVIISYDLPDSELVEAYHRSKILLHATTVEAGHPPLTILEAMACRVPVIGTFMGNGVLHPDCEITRDVNSIICAIDKVLSNYEYYCEWYHNKSKEYSWDKICEKLQELYKGKSKTTEIIDMDDMEYFKKNLNEALTNSKSFNIGMRGASIMLYDQTKILGIEPLPQRNRLICSFINGPRVESLGDLKQHFYVEMIDGNTMKTVHSATIENNMWTQASREWYTPWIIRIKNLTTKEDIEYKFDVTGKNVFIHFSSAALGDTIAWFPYIEEFRQKHNCNITCATNWVELLQPVYPEIKCVSISTPTPSGTYAQFNLNYDTDAFHKNKEDVRTIPLQKVAANMLGLEFREIKPNLVIPPVPVAIVNTKTIKENVDEFATSMGVWQDYEEAIKFIEFIDKIKPNNMMEIGTYQGGTFALLMKYSAGIKISLDMLMPNYMEQDWARRNEMLKGIDPNVHIIDGDSHLMESEMKIKNIMGGQLLDFLFIDADHTYEGVKQDYEMYSKYVKNGGWIAFHDINTTLPGVGVRRFWDELEGYKKTIVNPNIDWGGIGIIKHERL